MNRLTLKRSQSSDVAAGHSRGIWSVPQLGMFIWRVRPGQWALTALTTMGTDDRTLWLKRVGLAEQRFDTRRAALQALQAVVAVSPPGFYTAMPCRSCDGTTWHQYDDHHASRCADCCLHGQGWTQLTEYYGADNGTWVCRAGCGARREHRPA